MWDFNPNLEISVPDLFNKIYTVKEHIEGITLLGGEPLDQYEETIALLRICINSGLSTMLFTGYEMDEIQLNMPEVRGLLDILITGRYDEQKRTLHHQWIGSTNQTIHLLSDRYSNYEITNANYLEISLSEDGSFNVLGFPKEPTG